MERKDSMAGGVFVAGGSLAGTVAGAFFGMPVFGLLVGIGLGFVAAVLVWLVDRRTGSRNSGPPR